MNACNTGTRRVYGLMAEFDSPSDLSRRPGRAYERATG